MKAVRILQLVRRASPSSLMRIASFSSDSAKKPKSTNYDSENSGNGSKFGKINMKFCWNSASFIGSVEQPLRAISYDRVSAWTILKVRNSPHSNAPLRILLRMWDEIAESSLKDLRPNHMIQVSGRLECYKKAHSSKLFHKLLVRDLIYISEPGHNSEESRSQDDTNSERYKNRILLWQLFFRNPNEWRDCRKYKMSPRAPDFRHKYGRDVLWLDREDPPWIKKQLDLLDSRTAERNQEEDTSYCPRMSDWL